jgi:hypothetical protein
MAIPGSGARSIEDILNINVLGTFGSSETAESIPQTYRHRMEQPQSQQYPQQSQDRPTSRPSYGGIEGGRPISSMRHASAGMNAGSTRHALGGGSGPPWHGRSLSSSLPPSTPFNAGINDRLSAFEPRIIGGSPSLDRDGASGSRAISRGGIQASRPRRLSHKESHPPAHIGFLYGHHLQGVGAPVPFRPPTYLGYSFMRDRIQTDVGGTSVPSAPALSRRRKSSSQEGSDHISDVSGARPSRLKVDRKSSLQTAYEATSAFVYDDPISYLPSRWNEESTNKYLHVSEDGRNLHFHG